MRRATIRRVVMARVVVASLNVENLVLSKQPRQPAQSLGGAMSDPATHPGNGDGDAACTAMPPLRKVPPRSSPGPRTRPPAAGRSGRSNASAWSPKRGTYTHRAGPTPGTAGNGEPAELDTARMNQSHPALPSTSTSGRRERRRPATLRPHRCRRERAGLLLFDRLRPAWPGGSCTDRGHRPEMGTLRRVVYDADGSGAAVRRRTSRHAGARQQATRSADCRTFSSPMA